MFLRIPAHVQLEVTDLCNLRCRHCYHFDTDKMPRSKDLSDEKVLQLIEKLIENQIYSLVITGGEPLMRPDLTIKIVRMAKRAGIFTSINTNLLLLNEKMLVELKECGLDSLLISCPAGKPEIYKMLTRGGDLAMFNKKLNMAIASGISCLINMVVTKDNFAFIRDTAVYLENLGVTRFAATPAGLNVECPKNQELLDSWQILKLLEDLNWCADNLGLKVDILEPIPRCFLPQWCFEKKLPFIKRSCQAGRTSVSISSLGDIRPCSHNPSIYGNLFTESLEDIWGKMGSYRSQATPEECKSCRSLLVCQGGCRTNALAESGLINSPNSLMVGPTLNNVDVPEEGIIEDDFLVVFKGKLRWRKELNNLYSMSSLRNNHNIIIVNQEMFNFVSWLEKEPPTMIREMRKGLSGESRESFRRIILTLINKNFIELIPSIS